MPPEARLAIGSSQLVGWELAGVTLSTEGTNARGKDAAAAASIDLMRSISSLTIATTSSLVNPALGILRVLDSAISCRISALVMPVLSLLLVALLRDVLDDGGGTALSDGLGTARGAGLSKVLFKYCTIPVPNEGVTIPSLLNPPRS